MKNGIFEKGDRIIWINANNVASRGTVIEEYVDNDPRALEPGATRVAVRYMSWHETLSTAAPFKDRVGLVPEGFDTDEHPNP